MSVANNIIVGGLRCRITFARITDQSSPPGRCVCGSKGWEPRFSSSHRVALERMGMLRASTASSGTTSRSRRSSIPSGRCRCSRSSGATSTTMSVPTAPWATVLLKRPFSFSSRFSRLVWSIPSPVLRAPPVEGLLGHSYLPRGFGDHTPRRYGHLRLSELPDDL